MQLLIKGFYYIFQRVYNAIQWGSGTYVLCFERWNYQEICGGVVDEKQDVALCSALC